MRAGVWWSASALALLTLANALRTTQVEGSLRTGRRITAPSAPDIRPSENFEQSEDVNPTVRPRTSFRRGDTTQDVPRTLTRSRPVQRPEAESERPQSQGRNERYESRRTFNSRTRERPVDTEAKETLPSTENGGRSRLRQSGRRIAPRPTQSTLDVSSPIIDQSNIELVNSNMEEISRVTPRPEITSTQFRRRSSTSSTTENIPRRQRGRINTRPTAKSLDLTVSGTTNTLTLKEPTTDRTKADLRNSKKLRYRKRPLETDTNLTGQGITGTNEVTQSSQNVENITSQPLTQTSVPIIVAETTILPSSEATPVKTTTTKVTKVVRRPLSRGRANFRPSASLPKLTKKSEEISEDDNYPESFKALLQAKNGSTQTSSPVNESLSVKASQKVYKTSPAQTTYTGPTKNKYSRFRNKINLDEETQTESKDEDNKSETIIVPEQPKVRHPEYRPRGIYTPRSRKLTLITTATSSIPSSTEKSAHRYSRKFKPSTTESPSAESTIKNKRIETSNRALKKTLVRPSYYSRRNGAKNTITSSEVPIVIEDGTSEKSHSIETSSKASLPKTSYYSRLRNKFKNGVQTNSSVETVTAEVVQTPAEKKIESSVDMPLIFSLLKNANEDETTHVSMDSETKAPENEKQMFIIAVSSKESTENSTENDVVNKVEESEVKPVFNYVQTAKYHATLKNQESDVSQSKEPVTPSIRNIQTRKYGRKRTKPKEVTEDVPEVTSKTRDRNSRKFSDSYSKTTEPSTNGIPEPEKHKSRFSSKYRSSYLDKPFYKPTVPSITSSTAWLKFFVTDHELAKSVDEPKWFDMEDLYVTTEMSRPNFTTPSITHETSLELVEGEEFQLGPDMNAISFTQTRSTLASADLRLSESLTKPSQVMNVEALQHSSSVTVSIFDALADILTSTPRTPRLSTTTEVMQKQNINNDNKQTLNGVSNNINVNSARELASQDSLASNSGMSTNTKSVQNTEQTTPIVINRLSVGGSATTSLNTEGGNVTPVYTPIPTFPPTTPISARRPFAIKVLYSETESPTDKLSTATETTSNQHTTDPTMVYNTVSDLLITNNNIVSSELTSMLSNNINDIIQNLDEESRSKISVDMAKLLKSLIPRALDRLSTNNDIDVVQETTPYSLEAIKDTEIINVNRNVDDSVSSKTESLQSIVVENVVNSEQKSNDVSLGVTNPSPAVNSSNVPVGKSSTLSVSSSQTTTAVPVFTNAPITIAQANSFTTLTTPSANAMMSTVSFDTENIGEDRLSVRLGVSSIDNTNPVIPFPLSNFEDFTTRDSSDNSISTTQLEPVTLTTQSMTSSQNIDTLDNIDIRDPSKVSPLQLWMLSKKARVLKMIEDIIREHNSELATAPSLTELLTVQNNIPLSSRLTEIMNTMSSTSESSDFTINGDSTSPMTTNSFTISPLFTSIFTQTERSSKSESDSTTSFITAATVATNDVTSTTLQGTAKIATRFGFTDADISDIRSPTETTDISPNTTPLITTQATVEESSTTQDVFTNAIQRTTQENTETTTDSVNTETTQTNVDTTTVEMTTQADVENITSTPSNEIKQNFVSVISNRISENSDPPKKDYVIFGILPNNTVVRKDPNDDILETLTESSPYIIYGVLPNNTVIRRFPNGTRVPRVMQKIDVLPISPWSLRNPYSPIHNNPAIVRPQSNPIRVSTNIVTSTDTSNNGTENRLTNDTVNNQQTMIPSSALNINGSSSLGVTTATNRPPAEKSTASHVLSLRTSTMLPSVEEILLNSISSAIKEEMVISSMTSSTREPRILTLDIDPETKQIRTEKPGDGTGGAVFKFIPIDEITVPSEDTNVLKLATTKVPTSITGNTDAQTVTPTTVTETNTQTPQIEIRLQTTDDPTTTVQVAVGTPVETSPETSPPIATMMPTTTVPTTLAPTTTEIITITTTTEAITTSTTTTPAPTTTTTPVPTTTSTTTPAPTTTRTTTPAPTTTLAPTTTTTPVPTTTPMPTGTTNPFPTTTEQATTPITTVTSMPTMTNSEEDRKFQEDAQILENFLQGTERSAKSLNVLTARDVTTTTPSKTFSTTQLNEEARLLQAILAANAKNPSPLSIPNIDGNLRISTVSQTTTTARSIEDDIRQFEEDTKLLKALLAATGQNPASLNIPSLDSLSIPTRASAPIPTTQRPTTTTVPTTTTIKTTTQSIADDLQQFSEDARLLQALLQATGQNTGSQNIPIITGVTSNVRVASNPLTTSILSNPTTPINIRPVYTSRTTTSLPELKTSVPRIVLTTLQPRAPTTVTEEFGISTTLRPNERRRLPTTQNVPVARRVPATRLTTEVPSTSTFSDEEDLLFLQNLKSVLNTNTDSEDPETALANRVIALAVEKSLNEIQSNKQADIGRTGKNIPITQSITTTTTTSTTTSTTTQRPTTTPRSITTTIKDNTPSIEDDIKQFQEDTKLLQSLLKATGQDPSKFNIPALPNINTNVKVSPKLPTGANADLKLLSNLLALPSPLNEPFDSLAQKPNAKPIVAQSRPTTARPFGAKIAVKDDLKNVQDEAKLLQTLIKLQGVQETTTQQNKLAITGQSSDEALQKLIQQTKPVNMVSEATKAPVSISTEYGKSNDALLAALLKEQGFGPTTASSLDEQLRLAALLNQVVVTPKARRTTTPPPPPPPPQRRPVLDGLAWLWQQWRETGSPRPSRRPAAAPSPSVASSTSNRVNWFGSGPFVGNADEQPSSNRIPLEPPRAVVAEQAPGRGQLVSAAINVTRAFSQFLGAAIQGAAQTVQSVIRAGQRAATDAYSTGSG